MYVYTGIILWMRPANARRRYIGWEHTQNYPSMCVCVCVFVGVRVRRTAQEYQFHCIIYGSVTTKHWGHIKHEI